MKKLPVAGPTYDYKLENIRNDIIEQELALCLKRQEDLATNSTIVDGDGNTTTLRANLDTEFYTRTEADTAIASATTSLVSETALNTALEDYTNTATLEQNFYTKTDADSAIASATLSLVSTSALNTALGDYTTTASLEQNYYTETEADTAISSAITTNNITLGNTYATISSVSSVSGDVDAIEGKYAVKVDNNGHVSGFGLISTANNATPTSTFTVTADAFKIVDTSGSATPTSPFEVYTTSRTVDGVSVPAGVYMENANITAANIKTLDVDVINLDGVTLDTSGGQLIVKDGGINTDQIAANAISAIGYQNFTNSNYTVFNAQTLNTRVVEFTFATVAGVAVEFEYNLVFEPYAHSVSQNRLSSTTGNGWEVRARAAIAYNASIPTSYYFFGPEQRYFAEKHNISFAPLITATGTVILPAGNAQNHSSAKFAVYIAQSIRDTSGNLDTYWDEGRVTGTLKARYIKR